MESQLSLHEEMEALGSNIHNVPLISAGDMVGWNFALIPFNPYPTIPQKSRTLIELDLVLIDTIYLDKVTYIM